MDHSAEYLLNEQLLIAAYAVSEGDWLQAKELMDHAYWIINEILGETEVDAKHGRGGQRSTMNIHACKWHNAIPQFERWWRKDRKGISIYALGYHVMVWR